MKAALQLGNQPNRNGLHEIYVRVSDWICFLKGETKISLTLDNANEMQGKGAYQYTNRRDLGTYEVPIDEINIKRIYLYYKNTIPSGLAEGYEIWERL